MEVTTVAVLGGSGFVGRHLCSALAAEGYRVRVATRDRERARARLILLPTVEVTDVDIHDPAELSAFVRGADAVVNLVGVLHQGSGQSSFRQAHAELARKVVTACRERRIARLLHMSALNAGPDGPSEYLRTKGEAERIVRESGLAWTVFRPSVIFGQGDSFLNLFAGILKRFPVVPLAAPDARFQPVFVEDVAAVFERSLSHVKSHGQSYELCGPKVYRLRELVELVGTITGRRRPIVGLNDTLSYAQAFVMELFPLKQILRALGMLVTRDNLDSMKRDSVCVCEFPFGMTPRALEGVAFSYLGERTPRARYQALRSRAQRQRQGLER